MAILDLLIWSPSPRVKCQKGGEAGCEGRASKRRGPSFPERRAPGGSHPVQRCCLFLLGLPNPTQRRYAQVSQV